MPRLPFFRYTEQELRTEHERGYAAGRLEGRETLHTLLLGLAPDSVRDYDAWHLPDLPELLDRFGQVWRMAIDQNCRRQAELTQRVIELEQELTQFRGVDWQGRVDRLKQELRQAQAERDTARQAIASAQAEVDYLKRDFADKRQSLEAELDQADQLIVKYEAQRR